MLNAVNTPRWRAWLLVVVACWACVAPAFATAFVSGFNVRGPETRVWNFFPPSTETRQENELQVADSHQGNEGYGHEIASGVHDYLYANADPVGRFDPSGRFSMVDIMLAIEAVGTISSIAMPTIAAAASASLPYLAALGVASATANFARMLYDDDFRAYRTTTPLGPVETTLDATGLAGGYNGAAAAD